MNEAFDFIQSGNLPEYVYNLWERENGIDPRLAAKLLGLRGLIEKILFLICLSSIAIFINRVVGKKEILPGIHSWVFFTIPIFCIACFACICFYWDKLHTKYVDRFRSTIVSLLIVHPKAMKEFPTDETALSAMYLLLIVDLARLVLQFEKEKSSLAKSIARDHLVFLHQGACGFGFVDDEIRTDGLGPWFFHATVQEEVVLLDVDDWKMRYVNPKAATKPCSE